MTQVHHETHIHPVNTINLLQIQEVWKGDVEGKCIGLVCGLPLLRSTPVTILELSSALLPSWVVVTKSVLKRVYHKKCDS